MTTPSSIIATLLVLLDAGATLTQAAGSDLTDDAWASASPASIQNEVHTKAYSPVYLYPCTNGFFYIRGGKFNAIGNQVTGSSQAKWDGQNWLPLADGEDPWPQPNTYTIGDNHYELVRIPQGNPAVPDDWKVVKVGDPSLQLGENFNGSVNTLIEFQGELYAGGTFTAVGGTTANRVARWDGHTWSALGSGIQDGYLQQMAVIGSDLYVAGHFASTANNIARWNGTSWSALGSGLEGAVHALAVVGPDLYAGGSFITAGGLEARRIAKWNGNSWSTLGMGVDGTYEDPWTPSVVNSILPGADGFLYISGVFFKASGETVNHIARWDGSSWSKVGENGAGINGRVGLLKTSGQELYTAGWFSQIDGVPAPGTARWDGTSWSALSTGLNGGVSDIAVAGSDVYALGFLTSTGSVTAAGLAKRDGDSWSLLGSLPVPAMGYVSLSRMVLAGSDIYVSGSFSSMGGVATTNMARWDGTSWSSLDPLFRPGSETPLAASGTTVYAGYVTDGIQGGVGKWDGTSWTILGPDIDGWITEVAVIENTLYAVGSFNSIGGVAANNIARWDGSTWAPLGPGLGEPNTPHYISALAAHGSDLYAAVVYSSGWSQEPPPPSRLYKWDGVSWTAVGSATDRTIYALATLGDQLYVGGDFSVAGGKASGCLARVFLNGLPRVEVNGSRTTAFFRGMPEGGYLVDRTQDFITWETLGIRHAGATGGIDFTDAAAPASMAFYRAAPLEPNAIWSAEAE